MILGGLLWCLRFRIGHSAVTVLTVTALLTFPKIQIKWAYIILLEATSNTSLHKTPDRL